MTRSWQFVFPQFPKLQNCGNTKRHITQLWIHKSFWNDPRTFVDPQKSIHGFCGSTKSQSQKLWIHKSLFIWFFSHKIGGNAAHFFLPYQKNTVKIAHFWCSLDFQSQKTSTCPYVFQEVDAKKIKGPYELFTFLVCTLHSETNKIKEGRDIFMPENRNDHQGVESDVDNVACNAQRKLFFFHNASHEAANTETHKSATCLRASTLPSALREATVTQSHMVSKDIQLMCCSWWYSYCKHS